MTPLKIVKLVQTCSACPSQWDAWTDAGDYVYIRYRSGLLSVSQGDELQDRIFAVIHGGQYDGEMDVNELAKLTSGILDLSQFVTEKPPAWVTALEYEVRSSTLTAQEWIALWEQFARVTFPTMPTEEVITAKATLREALPA